MKKKIIAIMLTLTMCVGLSACGSTSDGDSANDRDETVTERRENTSDESDDQTESDIQIADAEEPDEEESIAEEERTPDGYINDEGYYVFGWYEQDGDESNGPEPIEWEILDQNENGTLLVSRYVLDRVAYDNDGDTYDTWETCSLREWLNNDFYNTAFDDEMKSRINTVTLVNEDNKKFGTPGGNDTNDKIFCLSLSEILRYYSFDSWDPTDAIGNDYGYSQALITPATYYASHRRLVGTHFITDEEYKNLLSERNYSDDCVGECGASWWLRSPGEFRSQACIVNFKGMASDNVNLPTNSNAPGGCGVRPALYINK